MILSPMQLAPPSSLWDWRPTGSTPPGRGPPTEPPTELRIRARQFWDRSSSSPCEEPYAILTLPASSSSSSDRPCIYYISWKEAPENKCEGAPARRGPAAMGAHAASWACGELCGRGGVSNELPACSTGYAHFYPGLRFFLSESRGGLKTLIWRTMLVGFLTVLRLVNWGWTFSNLDSSISDPRPLLDPLPPISWDPSLMGDINRQNIMRVHSSFEILVEL